MKYLVVGGTHKFWFLGGQYLTTLTSVVANKFRFINSGSVCVQS